MIHAVGASCSHSISEQSGMGFESGCLVRAAAATVIDAGRSELPSLHPVCP